MKLIIFDCDSTLSKIEGIDELARLRGDEAFEKVKKLTDAAMNGEISLDDVFSHRLGIIQPDRESCEKIGELYIQEIEPTALKTLKTLRANGWTTTMISGGLTQVIEPLAKVLGIERVDAVPLKFNSDGSYAGYDQSAPPTRNGGKPEIVAQLKKEFTPSQIIMVGDGISDLETKSAVDAFIGFGRYADREKVRNKSDHFIHSLDEILQIVDQKT